MSLFLIIAVGLIVLLGLWKVARLSTGAVLLVGAALSLGLVGYTLQGSPALPAAPVVTKPQAEVPMDDTQQASADLLGRFGGEAEALKQAESYFRIGRPDLAARVLKLGLTKNRNSPALWTGLGNAFVAHDRGFLSPSAEFAYNKALRLTPGFPGALYFYAVALAENGRVDEARPLFVSLVASMPPDMPIRAQLLADLEKMGVLKQGTGKAPAPVK
jgi:cytochrome c-type biogenesis protein CcmH/NrfG